MNTDADRLLELLPAIYRIRDAALAHAAGSERGPLEELLRVFAEQIAVVEENLEQLYDDLFIETCDDWVVPYIGDLIGYRGLRGTVASVASPRAEVAHTIALRRRKGTATVLEQLARDVTGWDARAVELFQLLATTQYMNHHRPHNRTWAEVRDGDSMQWLGTAFESTPRTVDVRRIEPGRGRHNIPNVGVFLWRVKPYSRTDCPATPAGPHQYRVSPLKHDVPLYGLPRAEEDISHIAEPGNVPLPLSRRYLHDHLGRYYGEQADGSKPSLALKVDGALVDRAAIDVSDLSGDDPGWSHMPQDAGRYAIDPQLGRIALPPEAPDSSEVLVTWHEGFSADLGGGEYDRAASLAEPGSGAQTVSVPGEEPTIAAALTAIDHHGVVVITDSGRYEEDLSVHVAAGGAVEIRAANKCRPTLVLSSPLSVTGGKGAAFRMNGLQVTGSCLDVSSDPDNGLASLELAHCTLVPGLALTAKGMPLEPSKPSLVLGVSDLAVSLERCVIGGVRAHERATLTAKDCVIDATDEHEVAFAASDGRSAGGRLSLDACTVIGTIHARLFGTVTDSILLAATAGADPDWLAPVWVDRKQEGCIRFSFLPFDALAPRRYRCQPDSADAAQRIMPHFRSLSYGTPAYCQLAVTTPDAIRRGAEDEGEMGVLHHLYGPQRETNLRVRLQEYLRVGLEAGIFYET